jgi:hypothetical protein
MTTSRRRSTLPAATRRTSKSKTAPKVAASRSRIKKAATPKGKSGSAKTTTDHEEIREWVESHGGHPATVKRTTRGKQAAGVLRIDFPGFSGEQSLEEISWDQWFKVFDERKLAFLYQSGQGQSRFNKLVSRQGVKTRAKR